MMKYIENIEGKLKDLETKFRMPEFNESLST